MTQLRFLVPMLVLTLLMGCTKQIQDNSVPSPQPTVETHTINVKFDPQMIARVEQDLLSGHIQTKSSELNLAFEAMNVVSIERMFPICEEYEARARKEGLHQWYTIRYTGSFPKTKISGAETIEEPRKIALRKFNDPYLGLQWGFGTGGTNINVQKVWDKFTTGNPSVIVAVVDGGIDLRHEDLKANVIAGGTSGSKNFVDNNFTIYAHEHGTHVAGTISAINGNGLGVCSVAGGDASKGQKGVKLMSCQIFKTVGDSDQGGDETAALVWAADHGAVIANNSWGYYADENEDGTVSAQELASFKRYSIPSSLKTAIDYFTKYAGCDAEGNQKADSPMKGGLVFFAAGNENIDYDPICAYDPVISVASVSKNGTKSSFSNYGSWVDLCAPGDEIASTCDGSYYYMSGTSMACPHAAGVAALLCSYFAGEGFTAQRLRSKLLEGANANMISSNVPIGKMLDAYNSLLYDETPREDDSPLRVEEYSISARENNIDLAITLSETLLGSLPHSYEITLSSGSKKVASHTLKVPTSACAGDVLEYSFEGLNYDTEYSVYIDPTDIFGNLGERSETKSARTAKNNPPVISAAEYTVTLKAHLSTEIPFSVKDPEGHSFTLSLDGGSAAASLQGSSIKIVASEAPAGEYTAILSATDSYGAIGTAEFHYTILENHAPVVTKNLENILSQGYGQDFVFDLDEYFKDPDDEPLSYSFESTALGGVELGLKGNVLNIHSLRSGSSTIKVIAKDFLGMSISQSFSVVVRPKDVLVEVFPRPVKTTLTIRTGKELLETSIALYSSLGKLVFSDSAPCSAFEPYLLDMSGFAPGTYKIKLSFGSSSFEDTVVKI